MIWQQAVGVGVGHRLHALGIEPQKVGVGAFLEKDVPAILSASIDVVDLSPPKLGWVGHSLLSHQHYTTPGGPGQVSLRST